MKLFARNSIPQGGYPFAFQGVDTPPPDVGAGSSAGGGGYMKVLLKTLKALRVLG
jgi:hypothetical protein